LKVNPNGVDVATCVWGEYDIGAGLVSAGWAIANTNETDIYAPYEAKAQANASGLWSGSFYSPQDWREIKKEQNNFVIKRSSNVGKWFNFKSLF
jgi:endonuclease YncB( thermonuclease family)